MMEKKSVLEWLELYAEAGLKSANRRSEYYCVIDWRHPKPNTVAMTMLEISEKAISSQS